MSRHFTIIVAALLAASCGSQTPTRPSVQQTGRGSSALAPIIAIGQAATVEWRCVASGADAGSYGIFSSAQATCPERASRISASSVSGALVAPNTPTNLTSSASGSTVFLTWSPSAGGDPATSYQVEAGSAAGRADLANLDTGSASPSLTATGVPAGTYFVRVRGRNGAGLSGTSNETVLVVGGGGGGCNGAPGAPSGLSASSSGSTVSLNWSGPAGGCAPTSYFIEAGSAPGRNDLADFNTGNTSTSFSSGGVGNGTYYVRVRSANAAGKSAPSSDATLVVGGGSGGPQPPAACAAAPSISATVNGNTANISWADPPGGAPPSYMVEIGTSPGASNTSVTPVGATPRIFTASLPVGTYYIRMRSVSSCGTSAASNEMTVTITSSTAPLRADFSILKNHPLGANGQCVFEKGGTGIQLKCIFNGTLSTGNPGAYSWSIPALGMSFSGAIVTDPLLGPCGTDPGSVTRDVILTVTSPAGSHSTTKTVTLVKGAPC